MDTISYKLDIFEGPLDLLLHLISKHKLNIYDIPILELVGQYIAYVKKLEEENMEIASEFLEMAARLIYIKTVSLLPVYNEAENLKKELTGELLEYRECKRIAGILAENTEGFNTAVREPLKIESDMTYTRSHSASELVSAYIAAAGKRQRRLPPPAEAFSDIVSRKIVSVSLKIRYVMKLLSTHKKKKFINILEESESRSDMVAVFLAVLELAKGKRVKIQGSGEKTTISIVNPTDK
ncbi:MAG: segregation/condensation protein A [Oscillospiraceae bacterium]|nr:segregation/condensation protein A [Oscillospiraceae bacterium]